jgi:hypothetical protein
MNILCFDRIVSKHYAKWKIKISYNYISML